jgi:hypothetical protein
MRRAQLQASFSFAYGWMDGSPILLLSSSWEERAKRKNNTKNQSPKHKRNTLSELLQGVSFKLTPDEGEKGWGIGGGRAENSQFQHNRASNA